MGMELYESLKRGEDVRKNLIALKQELKEDAARDALQGELQGDPALFAGFLSHEDPKVRKNAALVLGRLGLLNTHGAIILPAVFSTFPVFLSYGGFRSIPCQMLEAARVDGAGEITIFVRLGLPLGKSGLLSAMVLGFLEYWNLMEQPMAFLEDKALWPLSLYLPQITWGQAGFAFCASVITLIPAAFVFVIGQDYLEQGIIYSGLKE